MDDLCRFAANPLAFVARYSESALISHIAIVTASLAGVGCPVMTQCIKTLIDAFATPPHGHLHSIYLAGLVDCSRRSVLAARELDRQRRVCEGDRRPPM
jgi:hypothetical protein